MRPALKPYHIIRKLNPQTFLRRLHTRDANLGRNLDGCKGFVAGGLVPAGGTAALIAEGSRVEAPRGERTILTVSVLQEDVLVCP